MILKCRHFFCILNSYCHYFLLKSSSLTLQCTHIIYCIIDFKLSLFLTKNQFFNFAMHTVLLHHALVFVTITYLKSILYLRIAHVLLYPEFIFVTSTDSKLILYLRNAHISFFLIVSWIHIVTISDSELILYLRIAHILLYPEFILSLYLTQNYFFNSVMHTFLLYCHYFLLNINFST